MIKPYEYYKEMCRVQFDVDPTAMYKTPDDRQTADAGWEEYRGHTGASAVDCLLVDGVAKV